MSGQRPPEWEGPDDGHPDDGLPDERHPDDGYSDLELSGVTSFLASVHSPALPASFEARISAAIAAESAARAAAGSDSATEPAAPLAAAAGPGDAKGTVRSANPEEFSPVAAAGGPPTSADRRPRRGSKASRRAARASGPGDSRPGSRRRRLRMPSMQAASWTLVCCLVLGGFGFLVTRGSGSSSSSEAASAASSQSASAPAGATAPAEGSASGRAAEAQPDHASSVPSAASSASAPTGFLVYSTGTVYKRSTLVSQVRGELDNSVYGSLGPTVPANSASATAPAPTASDGVPTAGSSAVGGALPSPALSGCVSRLTGGATPSLVDRASYDGIPAYIIAVPTQVWAVRLGCTAADTQLLARVPLKG